MRNWFQGQDDMICFMHIEFEGLIGLLRYYQAEGILGPYFTRSVWTGATSLRVIHLTLQWTLKKVESTRERAETMGGKRKGC